jgi:hypothetical protein
MTLNEQLLLHDAAELCGVALLRPATIPGADPFPIIGFEFDLDALMRELTPALDIAWPERSRDIADFERFLHEAYSRCVQKAELLSDQEAFVPAASWRSASRDVLLEHLRRDLDALVGGVRAEGLWRAFTETDDTAPLAELVETGLLIKLRALGDFFILKPSSYHDELRAAQFFPTGKWADIRDAKAAERMLINQRAIHKEIAHLTVSRPLPEEIAVYRPGHYRGLVEDLLALLDQFTGAVDTRLLPNWWPDWVAGLRPRLDGHLRS